MTTPDHLRDALRDLADEVAPADLYAGSVRRSRRIARREAAVGTSAAVLVLAVLAGGLWRTTSRPERAEPPAAAPGAEQIIRADRVSPRATRSPLPTTPAVTEAPPAAPATERHGSLPLPAVSPSPRSEALADLPGHVFYQQRQARPDVVRLTPADGDTDTVLAGAPSPVGVSPDGERIAYEQDGTLLVAGTRGGPAKPLATGVTTTGQAPAWSPDGTRLLVHAAQPAILEVGSGALTPLPADLDEGRHFRWSGDGNRLVFATSSCALRVAGDGVPQEVPAPAACQATSVDVTGDRVTVPLESTGTTADAVLDTGTGALIPLPVDGLVVGTVFDDRGNLLVRAVRDGVTRLSLFAAGGTLLVQAPEPGPLKDLDLLAYTR